jgi:hypothetical protein
MDEKFLSLPINTQCFVKTTERKDKGVAPMELNLFLYFFTKGLLLRSSEN